MTPPAPGSNSITQPRRRHCATKCPPSQSSLKKSVQALLGGCWLTVQPIADIRVRSVGVIVLIWPDGLKARNASAPALPAQSPISPVDCVFQLSRFVAPPFVEK